MARKPFAVLVLLLGTGLAVATSAAADSGLAPVDPSSTGAEEVSDLYYLILVIAVVIFLLVTGSLLLFIVRFRSRGRPREIEGPQIRGNTRLELAWTAVPVLFLIGIAAFVFYKLPEIDDPSPASAAATELEIEVIGHRFYWEFRYPNDVITVDRMRVPLDRVVELAVTAEDSDVVHSWWIPALGPKMDAIPGQTNRLRFRATKTGVYEGNCAEFCGIQHAQMLGSVEVVDEAAFDAWLTAEADDQRAGRSALGEETWEAACSKCHALDATGLIGPPLQGNSNFRDSEALEEIVKNGRGKMPPIGPNWEPQQFDALFRYVRREFGQAPGVQSGG